ncbi:MAG: WYL domain-containing protein, partial [Sphaerochaetaceae bacterium]|nr:WYL domain-containing protein [Sphaerochaetaceae bacterium]
RQGYAVEDKNAKSRVSGESKKEVTERAKRLKERLMTEGWQVQGVAGLQEGLLKCATPLFVNNGIEPIIEENIGFPLTSDSIAGLYPFIFETLYDKKGILLGEELQNGGKIVIDPYYYIHEPKLASRNNRINGNFVIVGTAGSGKTTATNLLIRDCIKEKKLTIWIDPENKNDKLTKHYGGTFIDWGKKGNIINPFDLKPISFDEDDDSYSEDDVYDTDQAIKNNIEDIKQIFAYLYPNISDNELSLIGSIVIGAYEKVGIYPDENGKYPSFKTMTVDDMPTFTEFGSALEDAIQVGKEVKDAEVVIDALKRSVMLEFSYKSPDMEIARTFLVAPYCVRLFRRRWYMLGLREGTLKPHLYSLDRMIDAYATEIEYTYPKDFSADDFYSSYFGIDRPSGNPETIRLKASARQADNLRALPLHASQKETEKLTDGKVVFEYHLVPSSTFIGEIMQMQGSVEVLEPASLRQRIHERAQELANIHR